MDVKDIKDIIGIVGCVERKVDKIKSSEIIEG